MWRLHARHHLSCIAFGLIQALETLVAAIISMARTSEGIDPEVFVIMPVLALLYAFVFVCMGRPMAYVPARALDSVFNQRFGGKLPFFLTSGIVLSIILSPVPAALLFRLLPPPDGPNYFTSSAMFIAPMIGAGAACGYAARLFLNE